METGIDSLQALQTRKLITYAINHCGKIRQAIEYLCLIIQHMTYRMRSGNRPDDGPQCLHGFKI